MNTFKIGDKVRIETEHEKSVGTIKNKIILVEQDDGTILVCLPSDLTLVSTMGVAETVEEWPQVNDRCYSIEPTGNVAMRIWSDNPLLLLCREFGNLYRTRKDAEAAVERVRKALRNEI